MLFPRSALVTLWLGRCEAGATVDDGFTGGISRLLRHGLGDGSSSGASCRTHDENGLAVWTLRIGKEEIPGRWVIVDREFRRAP